MDWENGTLREARIQARFDRTCRIRPKGTIIEVLSGSEAVKFERSAENVVEFEAQAGKTYLLRF
jgi:hypothetical protein